jgi:putative peptidoglycan lipid II flippase
MPAASFRRIGLASLLMMASVFLSRVFGLLREMAIAHLAGAGGAVDAYQVAFILPEILNHAVATGFLSVTFIPLFIRHLVQDAEDEAWRVFGTILCLFGTLLSALVAIGIVLAPLLVRLAAPGLEDPATLAAAVRMTRIILPAQVFFYAGGLLMAVQFARDRFLVPALAPLVYNLGIILAGVLLFPWLGVEGFAWGVLGGAAIGNFAIQWAGARRVGMRLEPGWDWGHPDVRAYVRLTLPLMLGLTMTFSTEFLFRFFGSYLPAGSIAVLNFSLRVMLILVGVFGQAVGTASFPTMARLAAAGDLGELNRLLNGTLRYLALVIPCSALLMVLSPEVVRVLFQHGRFDAAAAGETAEVLVWFLAGGFAFAAYTVVVRGYFALRNTLFPAVFGTLTVLLSLPLYPAGIAWMGSRGVALAVSVSGVLQAGALFALWSRRSGNAGQAQVLRHYLKLGLISLALAPCLAGARRLISAGVNPETLGGSLAVCAGVGVVFVGLMLAAGRWLGIAEIQELARRARRPGRLMQGIEGSRGRGPE